MLLPSFFITVTIPLYVTALQLAHGDISITIVCDIWKWWLVWWRLVIIIFSSFEISIFWGESWRIYTCISNVRHTIWIASHGSKLYCCLEVEKKKIEDYLPEIFTLFKMTNKTDCLIILFYLSSCWGTWCSFLNSTSHLI